MIRLIGATLVLYLVLIQPNHPAAMTWGGLAVFPLELPPILAAVVLLGTSRAGQALRVALTALLLAVAVLKLADYGTFIAFNRGFNLAADMNLVAAGWRLAHSTFGMSIALLGAAIAFFGIAASAYVLLWAMRQWARLPVNLSHAD